MSLGLDDWLIKLKKEPFENSLAIYDIENEYPKNVKVYYNSDGFVLLWLITKAPTVFIKGSEDSIMELLKEHVLSHYKEIHFDFVDRKQNNFIHKYFRILDATELFLYYLEKNDFSPIEVEEPIKLESKHSVQIQEHWQYSNQITDPNYYTERIKNGFFYGITKNRNLVSYLGSLGELDNIVVLGMLFTKPEYRRKHFGISCASRACSEILKANRIPMCYADTRNIASNRLWEKLGFKSKSETYYFIHTLGLKEE